MFLPETRNTLILCLIAMWRIFHIEMSDIIEVNQLL